MADLREPIGVARELAFAAGLPDPVSCERLSGGRNNQTFRTTFSGARDAVLKLYHYDPRDNRPRLRSEWSFLQYVWARGVRRVPRPIVMDETRHAALFAFLDGSKCAADELDEACILQCASFIRDINSDPIDVFALEPASEACFSISDHVTTVERRVRRLSEIDNMVPFASDAIELVSDVLRPTWARIRDDVCRRATGLGIDIEAPIGDDEICVSPSDFGFHNALRASHGQFFFIDFEYAGRDDPAKLVCDYLSQPEIPIPSTLEGFAAERLFDALRITLRGRQRSRLLQNTYRVKWACIMLNEFLPVDGARRLFSENERHEARCEAQLVKVRAAMTRISTNLNTAGE